MKTALVTGVNGMDGSHLADFLLEKGYEVWGLERRTSHRNRINTGHLVDNPNFHFIDGDLTDQNSLYRALQKSDPDEVYNLAAQSFVGVSWDIPEATGDVNALGTLRMLEAIREYNPAIKFYQACTSEMYGKMVENPANESTPFYPRSPYGVAKLYAYWITKNYRESYDMFACSGILFNHESERRGIEFVTRKISDAVARISLGMADGISLGNLDSKRDWGYAPDTSRVCGSCFSRISQTISSWLLGIPIPSGISWIWLLMLSGYQNGRIMLLRIHGSIALPRLMSSGVISVRLSKFSAGSLRSILRKWLAEWLEMT